MTEQDATASERRLRQLTAELDEVLEDPNSEGALTQDAYGQLRKLAARLLRRERQDHTLQPTDLVHEAYLQLQSSPTVPRDKAHFYRAASVVMRHLLIAHARRRNALRREGRRKRLGLTDLPLPTEESRIDLLALEQALQVLEAQDARKARLVELKFFGGCSIATTAEALGLSTATVEREWRFVKAWLVEKLDSCS